MSGDGVVGGPEPWQWLEGPRRCLSERGVKPARAAGGEDRSRVPRPLDGDNGKPRSRNRQPIVGFPCLRP